MSGLGKLFYLNLSSVTNKKKTKEAYQEELREKAYYINKTTSSKREGLNDE